MPCFATLVENELRRARDLHPRKTNSLHEGYGVLLEEVDEFWDEVKKKASKQKIEDVLAELVQIAASAQRIAEDLAGVPACALWREVDIIAPVGMSFGTLEEKDGKLVIASKVPGGKWSHDIQPGSSLEIQPGYTRYCVNSD